MSGILSLAGMNSRQPFVSLRIAIDDRQKFGIRALGLRIATAEKSQSAVPLALAVEHNARLLLFHHIDMEVSR
jgi:hypothetical protein